MQPTGNSARVMEIQSYWSFGLKIVDIYLFSSQNKINKFDETVTIWGSELNISYKTLCSFDVQASENVWICKFTLWQWLCVGSLVIDRRLECKNE